MMKDEINTFGIVDLFDGSIFSPFCMTRILAPVLLFAQFGINVL
jgi:hypothetical protein